MKLYMNVCLRTKFQVPSIILTSFRQAGEGGGIIPPPTPQNRPPKSPPRLGLKGVDITETEEHSRNCYLKKSILCVRGLF